MIKKELQIINDQALNYNNEQIKLIKSLHAKDATNEEFELLLYMSKKYNLDILTRQIWCIKYKGSPAQIYSGRDGFLSIAHRSGLFNGMKSGTKGSIKTGDLVGFCEVYRKDMTNVFYAEVDFEEYTTHKNLWNSKPKTMIQKVAESQALRKAFDISGLYAPEEMGELGQQQPEIQPEITKPKIIVKDPIQLITKEQKNNIWNKAKNNKMSLEQLQEFSYKHIKQKDLKNITAIEAMKLFSELQQLEIIDIPDSYDPENYIDTPFEYSQEEIQY